MHKFLKLPSSVIFSILVIVGGICYGVYQEPESFVPVIGYTLLGMSIFRIFIYLMRVESRKLWSPDENEES